MKTNTTLAPVNVGRFREQQLRHFLELDHEQQRAAINRLALCGHGDATIAQATGLSVEMIRRILGERGA